MKETIKLNDFLSEYAKKQKRFAKAIEPEIRSHNECPLCRMRYADQTDKFCSKDGNILEVKKYEYRSKDAVRTIIDFFYNAEHAKFPSSFPYEYVDSHEIYDDDHSGDSYFIGFIFKRKSDNKFFEFTIDSNGYLDGDLLYEVKKIEETKSTWK